MEVFKKYILPILFILSLALSAAVFVVYTLYFANSGFITNSKIINPELSSHYATFIGGVIGTILTFATIIIVWRTFITQREELNATKHLLDTQKFESTFFSLLNVQRSIKINLNFNTKDKITSSSFDKYSDNEIVTGDNFFSFASEDFRNLYLGEDCIYPEIKILYNFHLDIEDVNDDNGEQSKKDRVNINDPDLIDAYNKFFRIYSKYLGHYFRCTYHILNYIEKDLITKLEFAKNEEDRKIIINRYQNYTNILQSQMSSSELFLIFYNGLFFPSSYRLINEFKLVENLPKEELLDEKKHINLYDKIVLKSTGDLFSNR